MSTKRAATETKRDAIKRKIDDLSIHGDSKFVLSNNDQQVEFKIISICGKNFKVFGGLGQSLHVFHEQQEAEEIVEAFEQVLKERNLCIDSCFFLSPTYFA